MSRLPGRGGAGRTWWSSVAGGSGVWDAMVVAVPLELCVIASHRRPAAEISVFATVAVDPYDNLAYITTHAGDPCDEAWHDLTLDDPCTLRPRRWHAPQGMTGDLARYIPLCLHTPHRSSIVPFPKQVPLVARFLRFLNGPAVRSTCARGSIGFHPPKRDSR